MPRYLITQSLIASWAYTFDCREGREEAARQEFMRTLRREKGEQTEAMRSGVLFENAVYALAAGAPNKPGGQWENGVKAVADIIRGGAGPGEGVTSACPGRHGVPCLRDSGRLEGWRYL